MICSFIVVFLLPGTELASATEVSGSFTLNFQDDTGTASYSVFYGYPQGVKVGSNLTVQLFVQVDRLAGYRLYLYDYGVTVSLSIASGKLLMQNLRGSSRF